MSTKILLAVAALAVAAAAHAADDKAAPAAEKAPSAQQQRMKQCNVDAKGKKGDERKAFMKDCLSKKG